MLIKTLWLRWFGRTPSRSEPLPDSVAVDPGISHQRALEWIGQDRLERQHFYEKWVARENWLVYTEGLPLLLGYDPQAGDLEQDDEYRQQRQIFWEHLQLCVHQRLAPALVNPAENPAGWRAAPVELYRWAVAARVPMPDELDTLLSFVSSTIIAQQPRQTEEPAQQTQHGHEKAEQESLLAREQVLSALLSLSLQSLHQVCGRDGDTLRKELLESLYGKSSAFFNARQPPLSRPALHDLIDRSLEAAGLYR